MTLYLKYRPQSLEELDSQIVRESLQKIVASGKIPHAFLFSGPKGIGKTSAARILAKIVNCEKNQKKLKESCNKCEQCITISKGTNLDVIELDAASNRGIEDVRNLRDAVKLSPAKARKKVYIIDEAHMLTTEAANALLKTLEEPPEHVMFILATTNPEKLVETIRSRTTNMTFSKAKPEELLRSLQRVVKGEKLKIDKDALSLISKAAAGSFRDAVKLVEQIMLEQVKTDAKSVNEFLFRKKMFSVEGFLEILHRKDAKTAIEEVEKVSESGVGTETFLEQILEVLRAELLAKVGVGESGESAFSKEELIALVTLFSQAARELSGSLLEQIPVELAIISWCGGEKKLEVGGQMLEVEGGSLKTEIGLSTSKLEPQRLTSNVKHQTSIKEISEEVWRNILAAVKPRNTSIEALLRAAKPIGYDGKVLTLGVFYRFHKERLEDGGNRRILEEVVEVIFGAPVRIVCTLTEPPAKKTETPPVTGGETVLTEGEDKDIIKVAEEIFGN
ncbi:DNA polymerase III subunit gamma/tau [Patescibacteria group bacterium]|nr:DNA polymerase III subunit gamma/tau [Patescibacteria group bacterium]